MGYTVAKDVSNLPSPEQSTNYQRGVVEITWNTRLLVLFVHKQQAKGKAWETILENEIPLPYSASSALPLFRLIKGHHYLQRHLNRTGFSDVLTATQKNWPWLGPQNVRVWQITWTMSRLRKSNKMQQYADIYLRLNYSTCFGRPSRPSSGVHKTVVAAPGTDHTLWGASFLKRDHVWESLLPRYSKLSYYAINSFREIIA